MLENIADQRKALETPVDPAVIKTKSEIKGPYTSGEYIRWKLNDIFGPDNWQHTILDGPKLVDVNERNAYVQVTIRLVTQFADGSQVTHDDVGVWPLVASKDKKLEDAAPERYETVIKAAITDGVKACAEYLGICFRPMADDQLKAYLQNHIVKPAGQAPKPTPNGQKVTPESQPATTALADVTATGNQPATSLGNGNGKQAAPGDGNGNHAVADTPSGPYGSTKYFPEATGKRFGLTMEWARKIVGVAGINLKVRNPSFTPAAKLLPYFAEGKANGFDFDMLAAILKECNWNPQEAAIKMRANVPQ
jgi:hypothetical protein